MQGHSLEFACVRELLESVTGQRSQLRFIQRDHFFEPPANSLVFDESKRRHPRNPLFPWRAVLERATSYHLWVNEENMMFENYYYSLFTAQRRAQKNKVCTTYGLALVQRLGDPCDRKSGAADTRTCPCPTPQRGLAIQKEFFNRSSLKLRSR